MAKPFKRKSKNTKGDNWLVSWKDHTGTHRTKSSGTTDYAAAQRILAERKRDAALRREGLVDPAAERFAKELKRPLMELVAEYKDKLTSTGGSERYIAEAVGYVKRIIEAGDFNTARDISAQSVERYAVKLREDGRSARTIQAALGAIKSFSRWLVTTGKLPSDPLASVRKPNPQSDRRRERRMLLPDEWQHLERATKSGPRRHRMAGSDRALLYRLAIQTGLRASELRSLTRESVVLKSAKPYVKVKSGNTKNHKVAHLFIDADFAAALHRHVATKTPKAKLFKLPHESNMARMVRADLAAAREAWIAEAVADPEEHIRRQQSDFLATDNHVGESLDFHSLRHTCGAWLAQSGAHIKTVQSVMRHSTITLTMDTYGHLFPGAEAEAAGRLGAMLERRVAVNPGERAANAQQLRCRTVPSHALPRDLSRPPGTGIEPRKSRAIGTLHARMPLATIIGPSNAPLAQLAEQLTLNQ